MLHEALKSHWPEVARDRTQPVCPPSDTVSSSCCFGGSHATTLWSRVPANSCSRSQAWRQRLELTGGLCCGLFPRTVIICAREMLTARPPLW